MVLINFVFDYIVLTLYYSHINSINLFNISNVKNVLSIRSQNSTIDYLCKEEIKFMIHYICRQNNFSIQVEYLLELGLLFIVWSTLLVILYAIICFNLTYQSPDKLVWG